MLLYYIRHGDPTYDPDQLTPLGKRQAEAVARRLTRYGLDEIYVSSSNRAQETCRPTCEILKKEPVILDWANEMHAWKQLTVMEASGRQNWGFAAPEMKRLFASEELAEYRFKWYEHPAFQSYFSVHSYHYGRHYRNNAKSSDLYQYQNNDLTEHAPCCESGQSDKTGYTYGCCRCEQSVYIWNRSSVCRAYRQCKQNAADDYTHQKTQHDQMGGRKIYLFYFQ